MAIKTKAKTLSAKDILAKFKISRHTLWGLIKKKKFVKPLKHAPKGLKKYDEKAVLKWAKQPKTLAFLAVCASRRKALAKNKKAKKSVRKSKKH
jgi:predicted DNA-binding transcriptional regulator AlpA